MEIAMEKICETIMGRISSYELLNNFLPGVIYAVAVERLTDFYIFTGNVFEDVILCYVVGLIIGRIGSLIVERILGRIRRGKWLGRTDYKEYVMAEKRDEDGRLRLLSMTNNVYRSLIATFICVLLTVCLGLVWPYIVITVWAKWLCVIFGLMIVVVLLCFSYRKQTKYVAGRVKVMNEIQEDVKRK